jgi:hypothetical protein
MTREFKSYCHFCGKSLGGGQKLPRCSQCKISYYCGRKCQSKHWKLGHKSDCVATGHCV